MRAIDADALSKKLLEELHNRSMQGFGKGLMIANSCVINAPTIEPERKKGKWTRAYLDHEAMGERPSIFYCSVCNQCIAFPTNFCPSCGADMKGEQE